MLYAVTCYWPGVTGADLEQVAARAGRASDRLGIPCERGRANCD